VRPRVEPLEARVVPSWTALTNKPNTGGIQNLVLLSDGTVMALGNPNPGGNAAANTWYKLTPDPTQGYAGGTWSQLQSMSVARLFFPANVMPNGNVFVVGGEFSSAGGDTNTADMYNPVTNTWASNTSQSTASFSGQANFGDDPTEVLPNGTVLAGGGAYNNSNNGAAETWIYNPSTNQWSFANFKLSRPGPNGTTVFDSSDEETWVKLGDGSILTYDNWASNQLGKFFAERYIPSSNQWVDASATDPTNAPGLLSDGSLEIGPGFLLPGGRAFFLGTTGNTAFYDPISGLWSAGPAIPNGQSAGDEPGALLPNGDVLFVGTGGNIPNQVYEFNPNNPSNYYTNVTPGNYSVSTKYPYMLMLPTGQVLVSNAYTNQLEIYTEGGTPNTAWAPFPTAITTNFDGSATLTGYSLTGGSEGATFGDDAEMSTNFPIIQVTDSNGHVTYARTFNWSNTDVQDFNNPETVQFTMPAGAASANLLAVSASGVSSSSFLYVTGTTGNDTITLDTGIFNFLGELIPTITVNVDGNVTSWLDFEVSAVYVNPAGSNDTININSTLAGIPTYVSGAGSDTVNLGSGGSVQNINGYVRIENPPSFNTINIDDSGDGTARTVTVGSFTPSNDSPFGYILGLAPAEIDYEYADTTSVTLRGGSGGNTWNVKGTAQTTNIVAGGRDQVNVGNAGSVQGITGILNIEDPPSFAVINLDDSADPNAVTATVRTLGTNTSDFGGGSDPWGQVVGLAPGSINYEYGDTSSLTVQTGTNGGDVVNVQQTQVATNVVGNAFGTTVNVGNAGGVAGIQGTLNVDNPPHFSNINVDDSADTTARTVSLSTFTPSGDSAFGSITGLGSAAINYEYGDTNNVTLSLGNAANTVNVQATGGIGTTTINVASTATVNVTNAGSAQGIGAPLTLSGPAGSLTLTVDDSADTNTQTVTVSTSGVTGLTPGAISFTAGQLAALTLKGGSGNNTWNINSTNAPTSITAGNGNNAFVMTPASQFLDNILGAVTLTAGTGTNTLTVDDQNDTFGGDTYTIAAGSIQRTAEALISYSGIDSVTVNGSSTAPITYDVNSTAPGVPLTVNAGAATDTANLGSGNLDNLAGAVTYNAGGGGDAVNVNDTAKTGNQTYTVNPTSVSRGGVTVTFNGAGSLTVSGGTGANVYNIPNTAAGTFTTVNGGAANDTFNVSPTAKNLDNIAGALTLNGGGGTANVVTLTDQNSSAAHTYTLTGDTSLARTGAATISYSAVKTLTVNGGSGANSFVVATAPVTTAVTLSGGAGANTLTGPNATETWTISGANSGTLGTKITFSAMQNLVGGSLNDTFKFTGASGAVSGTVSGGSAGTDKLDYSALAGPITVNLQTASASRINGGGAGGFSNIDSLAGSTGSDTLIGPNADTSWTISSNNGGKAGTFAFTGIENLVGGSGVDVFKFTAAGKLSGTLDGGGAPSHKGNWLDYSGLAAAVTVNLATGSATGVAAGAAGKVANIQDVHGGNGGNTLTGNSQGNILIGGTGADTIVGGSGRSLLIGDKGSDSITGNSSNDILIGGLTKFDTMSTANENALMSILAEWQSADSYADRFGDINQGAAHAAGSHLNGSSLLKTGTGATVLDDTDALDTLTEAGAGTRQDWFFQFAGDTINNQTGEHVNNT
jgi:hypothetical protein